MAGEIGIKAAWTRKLYEKRLVSNIKAVLRHFNIPHATLNRSFGRLYLKTPQAQNASQRLAKVFGISSTSPALETTSKLGDITETSVYVLGSSLRKGNSFAVRCRRVGRHSYTSQEVCRKIGRRIQEAYPNLNLRVDLTRPEVTLGVEVREGKAFIFTDTIKGAGGMPMGTQPKLVCLLGGDVNSALACWSTMKRGSRPILLHFDNSLPKRKQSSLDSVVRHAQALSKWMIGFPKKLIVIPHGRHLKELTTRCPRELTDLVSKRLIFRIAEQIAKMEKAEGLVTGETIDGKDEPVLHDLRVEDEAIEDIPIYRPLIGFDTSEIRSRIQAAEIQDDLTSRISKYRLIPKKRKPSAPLKLDDVRRAEENLKIDKIIEDTVKTLRTVSYCCHAET